MLRFAPSPTGFLHVGNARVALLNFIFARKNNKKFLLRIDDTDSERSKKKFVEAIKEDLNWLGIKFDDCFSQSQRIKEYDIIVKKLKSEKKIYPCFETPNELEIKRRIQLKTGKPPIYDREALKLTEKEIVNLQKLGKKPHWRLFLDDNPIEWMDLIHDTIKFENLSISDPIVIRSDNTPLFTLTSVIDDAYYGITHVLRGDDHITNTAAQIKLFQYIDAKIPTFGHFPLLKSSSGGEMSKRFNSFSLREIKKKEISPDVLTTILSRLGTNLPMDSNLSLKELIKEFNIKSYAKNVIKFSFEEVKKLNAKYLKSNDYQEIKHKVDFDFSKEFWLAVRDNIDNLEDIKIWFEIVYKNKLFKNEKKIDDKVIRAAIKCLPVQIDTSSWYGWTKKISLMTNVKGKKLYLSLRLKLTGMEKGPEMNLLLPLLQREKIFQRLNS